MKELLCLLSIILGSVVLAKISHVRAGAKVELLRETQKVECFKGVLPVKGVDDEIEEEIAEMNKARIWNGRRVVYQIANYPRCSEINHVTVRRLIDEAANTWNKVENANVLLINVEDLETRNEVESNDNDSEELDELILPAPNEDKERKQEIDITLSFEPCVHAKHRNGRKSSIKEEFGGKCDHVYAHAHFYGDIHFNELMTWTDKYYSTEELLKSDNFLKPNLYSIALHEFGHSLGLRHTLAKEDVMFWDFSRGRIYERLELSANDITALQGVYPVKKRCRDLYGGCAERHCNSDNERKYCPETCADCDECGKGYLDDYLKCSESICKDKQHPMRPFCRNTCKSCSDKPDDVTECENGVTRDCEALQYIGEKKRNKRCRRDVWREACPLSCGVCRPQPPLF